jgi:hypothetical protein
MSLANPHWGAPRLHGELLKLGIENMPSHGREVHGEPAEAALSDVARFSQQSREGTRLYRLLRGADPELSSFFVFLVLAHHRVE